MKTLYFKIFAMFLFALTYCSCKKYLDITPNKSLATPTKLSDFQAILDHGDLTVGGQGATPALMMMGTDEYFFTQPDWLNQILFVRNAHIWKTNIYEGATVADWELPYNNIYRTNVVLDGIEDVDVNSTNLTEFQQIKGSALFLRAFYHYWLEETFGQPYKKSSSATDLGVPLRLNSDLEAKITRATVKQTFQQIIDDLLKAKDLVPTNIITDLRNRPSRVAVYAMLARTYLTMQDYPSAGKYADSCLAIYNNLLDYNTVNTAPTFPFSLTGNDEVIFQCTATSTYLFPWGATVQVNKDLYNSFENNDIRKKAFFRTNTAQRTISFKGHYTGNIASFSGLATDECYLIKAEAAARSNNALDAIDNINKLLEKRYTSGTFVPMSATNASEALNLVLRERKKELIFRGLRWSDLRRLNQEDEHKTTITRTLGTDIYTLLPGSLHYAYPIPDIEIRINGLEQNKY